VAVAGMTSAEQSDGVGAGTGLPSTGVLAELSGAFTAARVGLAAFLELLSLEARRAGLALVWMLACGFIAAICVVTAWLGLMAAAALWVISLGLPAIAAVMALAAINLLAGAGLMTACMTMSRDLLFSATRRQVAGPSPMQPPAP